MFELPNACELASKQTNRREKREGEDGQGYTAISKRVGQGTGARCQFAPYVRPRFRGFRFDAADDVSAFDVVGEVIMSPPLRFSCACTIEGVDDPADCGATGLGAFACCGVPFPLSGDDAGEAVDCALCGIVAGGICAEDGVDD